MKTTQKHPIQAVSRRTGLSQHVIRIWEKRYRAVVPGRSASNRRFYTDSEIERLLLLRKATVRGYSIGQIAHLTDKEIEDLIRDEIHSVTVDPQARVSDQRVASAQEHLESSISAIEDFDAKTLESTLTRAAVDLSQPLLIDQFLIPLMQQVGDLWHEGSLKTAQEHIATSLVRNLAGKILSIAHIPDSAPELIVTTPAGQLHEMGAVLAAATALSMGWRASYLGPNLPAEEIAAAARKRYARGVALSVIYPPDDPGLIEELRKLRQYLGDEMIIIAGGRSADTYRDVIDDIQAIQLRDMKDLRQHLYSLRS